MNTEFCYSYSTSQAMHFPWGLPYLVVSHENNAKTMTLTINLWELAVTALSPLLKSQQRIWAYLCPLGCGKHLHTIFLDLDQFTFRMPQKEHGYSSHGICMLGKYADLYTRLVHPFSHNFLLSFIFSTTISTPHHFFMVCISLVRVLGWHDSGKQESIREWRSEQLC